MMDFQAGAVPLHGPVENRGQPPASVGTALPEVEPGKDGGVGRHDPHLPRMCLRRMGGIARPATSCPGASQRETAPGRRCE